LERRIAGIGTRFIAGLLDSLILLAGMVVLAVIGLIAMSGGALWGGSGLGAWVVAGLVAMFFALYWGYFVFFELWMNGQTPGKRSQKIRVVREDGGALTFTACAIRNLLRVVDGEGGYMVAGVCMFLTRKSQRLGDLAAGTVVVIEAAEDYSAKEKPANIQWHLEATPEALRATGLTPEEFRILTNYWQRRSQLNADAVWRLLNTLVRPILARHGKADQGDSLEVLERRLREMLDAARPPAPPGDAGARRP